MVRPSLECETTTWDEVAETTVDSEERRWIRARCARCGACPAVLAVLGLTPALRPAPDEEYQWANRARLATAH